MHKLEKCKALTTKPNYILFIQHRQWNRVTHSIRHCLPFTIASFANQAYFNCDLWLRIFKTGLKLSHKKVKQIIDNSDKFVVWKLFLALFSELIHATIINCLPSQKTKNQLSKWKQVWNQRNLKKITLKLIHENQESTWTHLQL